MADLMYVPLVESGSKVSWYTPFMLIRQQLGIEIHTCSMTSFVCRAWHVTTMY